MGNSVILGNVNVKHLLVSAFVKFPDCGVQFTLNGAPYQSQLPTLGTN